MQTQRSNGIGGKQQVTRQTDGFRTRPLKLMPTDPGPPTHVNDPSFIAETIDKRK